MQTNTDGAHNCGPMYATLEVFEQDSDVVITTIELDDSEIALYAMGSTPATDMSAAEGATSSKDSITITIPDKAACY